jgi:hypothetical protein
MARKKEDVSDVRYQHLSTIKDKDQQAIEITKEVERVKVPCLTDALVWKSSGGQRVLEMLDRTKSQPPIRTWRLQVLRMANGEKPKPGDKIKFVSSRTNRNPMTGKKVSNAQIAEHVRKFRTNPYETISEYTIDENLQIECGYADAMHLLTQFGMHYDPESGPLSKLPETQNGGKVFNWRFAEVVKFDDGTQTNDTQRGGGNVGKQR